MCSMSVSSPCVSQRGIHECEMTVNVRDYLAVSYQQLVAAVFVQAEVVRQRQRR